MSAAARLAIARVARRNRIDLSFKNTARRAALQPKPTRIVLAVWHGEPATPAPRPAAEPDGVG